MTACGFIKHKKPVKVCSGSKNKYIQIYNRDLKPNDISLEMDKTLFIGVWAMVKTKKPVAGFTGVNTERDESTHVFYISYRENIEKKQLIGLNGKNFEIKDFENIDEENVTLAVYAIELGDDTLPVNDAW